MLSNYWLILIILTPVAYISVKTGKLTVAGGITGWIAGLLVFKGLGYSGVAMIATFFLLGTAATSVGMSAKQKLGLAEKDKGKRTSGQVVANAGAAAILGMLAIISPAKADIYKLMLSAAIASATSDTLSSELGNVYGKRFYNIITFKKDARGLNGVISFEGTIIGIVGSTIIAGVYAIYSGINMYFLFIVISGTMGNLTDSILGATFERKGYLGNNAVNFINTVFASLFALLLYYVSAGR